MNHATIGHNLAPFDPKDIVNLDILAQQLRTTYAHLFTEQAGLVAAANIWVKNHPDGVKDDEDQGAATEQVAQLMTVLNAYAGKEGSAHKIAKEPFLKGGRIVDAVLNAELAGPIEKAIADLRGPMTRYAQDKVKQAQIEARRLAQVAVDKAAAEAALLAANTQADPMAALEAEQAAMEAAMETQAPVARMSQVRGDLGGMSGLRGKWVAKVEDEDKLPRRYMMPNQAAIDLAMNQSKDKKTGEPTTIIPGVEFTFETSLAIRK